MSESPTQNTSEDPEDSSAESTGASEKPKIRLSLKKQSGGAAEPSTPASDAASPDESEIDSGAFEVHPQPTADPGSKPTIGLKLDKPGDSAAPSTDSTPAESDAAPEEPKPRPSIKIRGLSKSPVSAEAPADSVPEAPEVSAPAEPPATSSPPPATTGETASDKPAEPVVKPPKPAGPPPVQTAAKPPPIPIAPEPETAPKPPPIPVAPEPEAPAVTAAPVKPTLSLAGEKPAESTTETPDQPAPEAPAAAEEDDANGSSSAVLALKIAFGFFVVVGLISVVLFFLVKALSSGDESETESGAPSPSVAESTPEPVPAPTPVAAAPVTPQPVAQEAPPVVEPDFSADQKEAEKYLIKEEAPPTAEPIVPVTLEQDPVVTAFVETLKINGVREFSDSPKILVGSSFYPINSVIDATLDVRFVGLRKSTHEIIFQDSQGVLYYKRY